MHISKGKPSKNSTKVWITKSGGCIVADKNTNIPLKELREILELISHNYFYILSEWKNYYNTDEVKFYC